MNTSYVLTWDVDYRFTEIEASCLNNANLYVGVFGKPNIITSLDR